MTIDLQLQRVRSRRAMRRRRRRRRRPRTTSVGTSVSVTPLVRVVLPISIDAICFAGQSDVVGALALTLSASCVPHVRKPLRMWPRLRASYRRACTLGQVYIGEAGEFKVVSRRSSRNDWPYEGPLEAAYRSASRSTLLGGSRTMRVAEPKRSPDAGRKASGDAPWGSGFRRKGEPGGACIGDAGVDNGEGIIEPEVRPCRSRGDARYPDASAAWEASLAE